MAFITAPDFKIAAIEWVFRRPAQINMSGWTGRRTVVSEPWHGKWLARVQLAPMKTDDMRAIRSFFARAKGSINTFRLYASEGPQNNNGGVTASAAAAGAVSMTISGADVPMTEGQFVTVNGQLLLLTANQSGSTITFEPPLRAAVAGATTVVTRRPYAVVYLANSDSGWSAEPGVFYNVSFDVEEAILETDGAVPELTSAPFNTVAPVASGTPTQGQTLSTTNGTWLNGVTSYAYQWLVNGNPISGATASTYVVGAHVVGGYITARVTATNAPGSVAAVSNSLGPVAAAVPPTNLTLPAITGSPYVSGVLTVSNGTWSGTPTSYTRQWYRNGVAIGGATASTYTLAAADADAMITVTVTAINAYGSTPATSAAVGPIDPYALYLDFDAPEYAVAGTDYALLSSVPGYTYTRTGEQGAVNAAGAVAFFAANTPAINSAGYHAFGAVTNLLRQSQDFSTTWLNDGSTETVNTTVAPDGTTTADTITASAAGGKEIYQTFTIPTTVHTASVFLKRGNNDHVMMHYNAANIVWFNLAAGTVGTQTSATGYIIPLANGWYRCVMVFTPAAANGYVALRAVTADGNTTGAADGQNFIPWEFNVFSGTFPDGGPVITTVAATAAIGEGHLDLDDAVGASADQLFIAKGAIRNSTDGAIADWNDNTDANRLYIYYSGANLRALVMAASVNVYNPSVAYTAGTELTMVVRRLGGNWRFGTVTGGALTWHSADTAGAFPTSVLDVNPANYRIAGGAANDQVQFVGRKIGTFTSDAEVLAAVAGL